MRSLTYVVGQSADGFVCGPDGSYDYFPFPPDVAAYLAEEYPETIPTHAREQLGITTEYRHFDTVLQGRVSYQIALDAGITSPYAHMRQYVLSRTLASSDPAVAIVSEDPCGFVRKLKKEDGLGICVIGGPRAAGALLPEIDELLIKRYPVVAGAGLPMFAGEFAPQPFEWVSTHRMDSGVDFTRFRRRGER